MTQREPQESSGDSADDPALLSDVIGCAVLALMLVAVVAVGTLALIAN